ncbi:MAG: hypothetical protein ACK4UP_05110 [Spirosomataceae bacterium]
MIVNNLFLEKIIAEDFRKVLRIFLPTRYHSHHIFDNNREYERIGHVGYLIILLYFFKQLFELIKQQKTYLNENYKMIVYVPNNKYERFYSNLFSNRYREDLLVISDTKTDCEGILKYTFFDTRLKYIVDVLWPSLLLSFKAYRNTANSTKSSKVDYSSLIHLTTSISQCFFLIYLSKHTKFSLFFSLHPNGDFHNLIRITYSIKVHSIRPDTTSYSEEHKYIKTDFLYYKSKFEKEIYSKYNLNCDLLEAGYIYRDIIEPKINFNDKLKVLFVDTCTNKQVESVFKRRKAIWDYYKIFSGDNTKLELYHKFHPGLLNVEKRYTKKILKEVNVKIVDGSLDYKKYDIVIGFYSTLFHDFLCTGITYLELDGEYSLIEKNKKVCSPLQKIQQIEDLYNVRDQLKKDARVLCNMDVWKRYYDTYNIPNGKKKLLDNLLAQLNEY